ncbi:MAG: hypothetical protein EOP49_34205, partial [Sphingobacteriales bacterium]
VVNNLANIYFDYNSPIITNLAVTSIAAPNSCFTLSATTTAASCAGVSNGSITVTVNGGTAPFIYSITGVAPQSSPAFTALAVGTYAIAVTDANSCMVSVMATVDAAGGFTATGASTPASCAGVNNGSITVTPNGGTAPLTYSLDGGTPQAAGTFTGVAAGQHTVLVTDASGCAASVDVTVTAGSGFTAAASSTAASCGQSNGNITVTVSGGPAPYSYTLNSGSPQNSNVFNNVSSGSHILLVTDANGCTASLTVVVGETPITATITTTNSTCSGGGTIEVTGSNGTAPSLYSINGGAMQSSAIFDNLIAGSYVVLVQDANMCTYTETVTINVTPGTVTPTVSIIASSSTICEGEPVTFTATATNGGANPQYQWLVNGANAGTNAATLTINPTSDADVSVVLTSNDACASPATATSNTVTVAVNPSQAPSITISGNTTVDQGASATITSSVVNEGTTPSYQWQDSTSTHTWTNIAGAINSTIDYTPQQTGDGIRAILTSTA